MLSAETFPRTLCLVLAGKDEAKEAASCMSLPGVKGKKDFMRRTFYLELSERTVLLTYFVKCVCFILNFLIYSFFSSCLSRDTQMVWPLYPSEIQRKPIIAFKPSMDGGLVAVKLLPKCGMGLQIIR